MPENNNDEMSEAHKISLSLNFDPTFADTESEKEDDEAQITPLPGALKKVLWPNNEDNVE